MFQSRVDRGLYKVNGTPVFFTSVAVATDVNEDPKYPDGDWEVWHRILGIFTFHPLEHPEY